MTCLHCGGEIRRHLSTAADAWVWRHERTGLQTCLGMRRVAEPALVQGNRTAPAADFHSDICSGCERCSPSATRASTGHAREG